MARTILLTIKDNEVAEEFARQMLEAPGKGMPFVPQGTTIDAMIARPTLACKCSNSDKRQGRIKSLGDFTRARRYGWWVHAKCKRPTRAIVDRFIENHLGGYNNLLPTLTGGEPQEPHWIAKEGRDTVQAFQSRH